MSHLDTLLSKLWNRKPKPHVEAAERMFDVVNEAARRPIFFTDLGVADTVDGRFDLLMLHVFLAMDRLSEVEEAADVSQAFMNWTFRILDESLREAGVGDTSVPKKMHAMADAFYGRSEAYKAGLEADSDGPLREAIERNLYRHAEMEPVKVATIAAYMHAAKSHLDAVATDDLLQGTLSFPEPAL